MMQMHPYILNINEDAQLSGVVKLFIEEGLCVSSGHPQGVNLLPRASLVEKLYFKRGRAAETDL